MGNDLYESNDGIGWNRLELAVIGLNTLARNRLETQEYAGVGWNRVK